MDKRVKEIFTKVKDQASYVAEATGKKAGEVYEVSKSNLKSFDLSTEIDAIYKEIGKLVYNKHDGAEIDEEVIAKKFAEIKQKFAEIEMLKEKKDLIKNTVLCTNCNTLVRKEDGECTNCGTKLQ